MSRDGCESILCTEPIPLEGTHTFSATYENTSTNPYDNQAFIGVARRSANLNSFVGDNNSWGYWSYNG